MKTLKRYAAIAMTLVLALIVPLAQADATQVNSNVSTVALSFSIGESITVNGVPANVSFSTGATPTTSNITVTTTWVLAAGHTHLDTNLYFLSATSALSDGSGHLIPTSNVFANIGGGAYSACTQAATASIPSTVAGATCNVGFGLNAAALATQPTGTNTSIFTLQLQGLGTLPAGTYQGVLNIAAGAN